MARIPNRSTLIKVCSAATLLVIAAGGVFFVLAPYQASRLRADILGRLHASGEDPLVLVTAAEDGAYYQLGTVLRQHLDAFHSYKLDVRATQGSVENLMLLHEGKADLALIQGGLAADREGVLALANLGRQYLHLVVPADSSIESFRDLAGKRVGVGPMGGGSDALAKSVLGFFNFTEETVLVQDHEPDLRKAFLNGEIDAAFTVYSLFAPAMERLLGEGWYRLIPVAEAEAVARYIPGVFAETLPGGLYGPDRTIPTHEGAPFPTLAVNTLLVAPPALSNRQVYTMLELIFRGDFLRAARLTDLTEADAQQALHLPLHPAAEAFYSRHDPISADRFEILSFFLAGIVCLASVIHFLTGRHRQQIQAEKRAAIRPYFESMMDFGDEIETAANPAKLTRLIHKIMATQRGAERAWLEGHFDTEDMENLYAVYSLRCDNAFHKIFDLHLQAMRGLNTVEPARPIAEDAGMYREIAAPRREREEESREPWGGFPRVERDPKPVFQYQRDNEEEADGGEDGDYFSGSALAGIDTTKSELAERLPGRYDPALLYDTEVSGAGSVRVRKSKPQADLHAVVAPDVPANTDGPLGESMPEEDGSIAAPAPPAPLTPAPQTPAEAPTEEERAEEPELGPDQMMLF